MLWGVTIGYNHYGNNLIRAIGSKIAIGFIQFSCPKKMYEFWSGGASLGLEWKIPRYREISVENGKNTRNTSIKLTEIGTKIKN